MIDILIDQLECNKPGEIQTRTTNIISATFDTIQHFVLNKYWVTEYGSVTIFQNYVFFYGHIKKAVFQRFFNKTSKR